MKIPDQQLRDQRVVFYSKDVERLDGELDSFLELSGAKCAFLIDREGHLVTRRGEVLTESTDSLSALVAGSFAATKEMARLLGEGEFASLFHQGAHHSIQIGLVGARTLMATLWDDRTNLGLVRFYAAETGRRLQGIFEEMASRPAGEGSDDELSGDYGAEATAALDDLF